ncbi:ABC transporter family substrate-binding protein [Streptomyces pathocidini]|uniref:ABC transporter family substrate-binding protein n=1 Tax=Streptomyces pathocidini TaxID=1650571 RepID=A0ABW7URS8_9ACTN|nr:ABC transporter family substrate-binding protein [Streptomyces pathocidini]
MSSRTRQRRRTAFLVAGALLPLPVLAACGSSSEGTPAATAVPQDVGASSRGGLRESGTLRWAIDAVPATLNTFQSDADAATDRVAGAVLPALFTLDQRGRPQRNPDYLAAADVIEREPKQVVSYRLNKSAVWTDGRKLGVEDFTAQWQALRGKDRAFWTARNAGYERIQKIEKGAAAGEVRVTFAKPYTDWRSLFSPLYPRSVMGTANSFNDGARGTLQATAGPFALRNKGRSEVTLVRNPKWWGDKAQLDKVVFAAVPRDQRTAALAAGRLDVAEVDRNGVEKIHAASKGKNAQTIPKSEQGAAGTQATAARVRRAEATLRGFTVRKSLEPAYTQLALNGSAGPLADERVRRAVARAIDRKAIAKAVLGPVDLPGQALGSHLMMVGQQGYQDNSSALGGQDTEAAQALLSSAGWREGGGLAGEKGPQARLDRGDHEDRAGKGGKARPADVRTLQKDGKPLALRFVLPTGPGTEPLRTAGERISRMLQKVGIRTQITKVGDDSYFKDHIASGDYDLALWSWPASAYPATDARPIFAKPQPAPDGSLIVEQNYTRVGTDHIDQLFDQAISELDPSASRALVRRADARIWAAAGSIPLYQRPQLVAVRSNLANVGAFGFATPRYQDIGFKK